MPTDKNPEAEKDLIGTARNKGRSHKDLRDRAAKAKAAAEDDKARARRLRRDRTARWGRDRDGHWALPAKLEPHIGAEAQARLQARLDRVFAGHTAPAAGADDGAGAGAADRDRARRPERSRRSGQQPPAAPSEELVLDIDLAAYRRGHTMSGETCEIRGVGPVPVEIAHQWADDAFIKAIIRDGTDIRIVAHFGRHIPAHLRTALEFRDRQCVVPGCDNSRIEWAHHQRHTDHGPCSLQNLRGPCTPHHRQVTHDGYRLEGGPGHWRWIDPDGRVLAADDPADLPENAQAP